MSNTLKPSLVAKQSALLSPQIAQWLTTRPLFIGLDRDGTLVPLHSQPDKAIVTAELKTLLSQLADARDVVAAVVSARSRAQLASDFDPAKLILAGNYGLEIQFADGTTLVNQAAKDCRELLHQVKVELENNLPTDLPVILEDHGLSLCLHWHLVESSKRHLVHDLVAKLKEKFSTLCFRSQPTSHEVLPSADWDKAQALSIIAEKLTANNHEWFFIFIGDSSGDEPAFRWVNARHGLSIRVGAASKTDAMLRVDSPYQVIEFIREIVNDRTTNTQEATRLICQSGK